MAEPIRVAVSGAAGQIGYSLVFRIASGAMFGLNQPVSLRLLETASRRPQAEALEMELKDCAFPLLSDVRHGDDPGDVFQGADWVILLAGATRRAEGQTRAELLRANAPIFVEHARSINAVATSARVLVVANPCNTNCSIAMSHARDVPPRRWFALSRLDQLRATALLAEKAGVPATEVTRVTVWGNHSESCYPDFHNSWIGDRPAPSVITDRAWVRQVFEREVAGRSLEIIRRRGASPAATAAQAILGTLRSIVTPTPLEHRFSASVVSDGSYGVPRGLVFSFPLRTEDGISWDIVRGLYLDEHAQSRLAANVAELEHEAALAGEFVGRL
jgi:malate dehydrogenase